MKLLRLVTAILAAASCLQLVATATDDRPPIGINLGGNSDWSQQFAFANAIKSARAFQPVGAKGKELWKDVDEKGYPRGITDTPVFSTVILTDKHPAGTYVLTWKGTGKFSFPRSDVAAIRETNPGRIELDVETPKKGIILQIDSSDPTDPVRDLALWMPGCENSQNPFYPGFLEFIKPFGTYRFMDWMETNHSPIQTWADRPTIDQYTFRHRGTSPDGIGEGTPVEWMVTLCNIQKADAWFCMPHKADDDYVRRFATYVRDNLDPNLKVYVEYSNEVWNNAFKQTHHARKLGTEQNLVPEKQNPAAAYYAKRSVEIFAIWAEVFGPEEMPKRVVRVLAAWSNNPRQATLLLRYKDAGKQADALAIAPYIGNSKEIGGDPNAALPTLDEVFALLDSQYRKAYPEAIKAHKALADQYGLKLIAYESGQHLTPSHLLKGKPPKREAAEALGKIYTEAQRDPRMEKVYLDYFRTWFELGGGLNMHFSSITPSGVYGSWGIATYLGEPLEETPKRRALLKILSSETLKAK